MPELRQLRVFVAVAEELSFTRAAERLFLGQQAVSKSVRRLEEELGVELLERTLREGRADAVVARTTPRDRGLDSAALRPSPAMLCLPAAHRLAATEGPLS